MKKLWLLLLCAFAWPLVAQQTQSPPPSAIAKTYITSGTGEQPTAPTSVSSQYVVDIHSGYTTHSLAWVAITNTTVTGCSVQVDGSPDGVNWTAGGIISSQSCNSNGALSSPITGTAFAYAYIHVTAITAGQVAITYTAVNPLVSKGSGGGGTNPSSPCGDTSHALGWTGSAYDCQAITGSASAGGSSGQLQWNNSAALGGTSGWTTNGTTTITGGATSIFDISALTTSNIKWPSQTQNLFYASPNGSPGAPSFRAIVAADVPTLNQNTTGTAGGLSGTPSITVNALSSTTINGSAFSGTFTGSPTFSGNIAFTGTPTFSNTLALNTTGTSGGLTGTPSITVNGLTATTYNGGAFSGTFTGAPTFSGNIAFTGTPTFSNTLALNTSGNAGNITGTAAIAHGGTGQTTKGPAFDALSPTATEGDLIQMGSAGSNVPIAIGSNGTCLVSNGSLWAAGSCATGSIGGSGTSNALAKFTATATIGASLLTDNATTLGYSGTGGLNLSAGPLVMTQTAAPTGSAGSSWIWADSTALRLQMKNASNTAVNVVASGADINTSDQVVGLKGLSLPTLAASTGLLFDTSGTLSLPGTLPTSAEPAHTGDMTNTAGSLATTVSKINNTSFAGTSGHLVSFGAGNTPADSTVVAGDVITYHTPAAGIARTASGTQAITGSELSGDATTSGSNTVTVVHVNGVSYGTSPSTNTVPVVTGTNATTYETVPNAALANSAVTANGQTCTLGSNCNVNSGATSGTVAVNNGNGSALTGGVVNGDILTYHTPATGIARTTSGGQTVASSELSGDVTTSGSNATTVVALRNETLPTLAASTGMLYDTSGTLSLPSTLPTAAVPAFTGDMTNTAGSLTTTVGKIHGNSIPASAAANQIPVGTATSTLSWETVPDCHGSSNALNYTQSSFTFTCLSIATLSNPMTTLGDLIYGGAAGAVSRLAGATSGNSPYTLVSQPSGGAATAPYWSVSGIPMDPESSSSVVLQSDAQTAPDRETIVNLTNNTGSTAFSVGQAGSAGLLTNFPFGVMNSGSVIATATPTTSTVNNNTALKLVGDVSGHNPEMAFWWSDASSSTGNWWAAEILPTDANGRLGCEGLMALTGDATNSAGSCATTVSKINNTSFAGTNGDLVSFGAANVPADSSILATNVVTAASPYTTSGDVITAAGNNKTTSDSGIPYTNLTTAASPYSAGGILYAAAANRTTTNSADWAISTHTLLGGTSSIFDASAATGTAAFKVPSHATNTATAAGVIDFDTTNADYHSYVNGADSRFVVYPTSLTPTASQCATWVAAGSAWTLGSAACSSGGGDTITSPNSTLTVGGSSSATNLDVVGSAGEILAGATPALTYTPTLGKSGTAGTLGLFPASGNFVGALGTAATASNQFNLPASVFTTLHMGYCVTVTTTCTWTDTGYAYNAIPYADLSITAANIGTLFNIAQYDVLVSGGTSAAPGGIAPSSSSGQVFTSNGSSANPGYNDMWLAEYVPAANCNNTTAGAGWSIGSSGTVTCRAGTNNLGGYITITDTSSTFAQFTERIPFDWDTASNPYIRFYFASASDTTSGHTVIPQVKVSCSQAINGTTSDDATFSAAQSSGTVTFGGSAVANGFYGTSTVQFGSTQMSGCVAGGLFIVQVGRATDTATGNINFYGADVTWPHKTPGAAQAN